jgi:hypothetical protein
VTTDLDQWARVPRARRQETLVLWAKQAFGDMEATSLPQRGVRLLEEAIEAFQACGGDEAVAHKLVKFVFERPPGTVGQELGGVAVTTLLLAAAAGVSADEEECREIHRVLSKPLREFTERNANKNAAGFRVARCPWAGCATPDMCDGTKHHGPERLRGNSCCGNTGSHRESGREYCSTCGQELA